MIHWDKDVMNQANLVNEDLLEILNGFSENVAKKIPWDKMGYHGQDVDLDWYCSDEYLQKIVDAGRGHNGYPEHLVGVSPHPGDKHDMTCEDATLWHQIQQETSKLSLDLMSFVGASNRALTAVYPPGGGISWHNNANASAYNVIITWSEKGEGYWEHIDPDTKEHVRIPDKQEWQCKYGFFGQYEDGPHSLCYHKARTDCLRMTLGFMFNRDETGKNMAEMLIEEIETA